MKKKIITSTGANENGELLWCVHLASSFYDGEDNIPVDDRFFVLGKSKDDAEKKVQGEIAASLKKCGKNADKKIETTVVSLENLIVARNSASDGRMGCRSLDKLKEVSLSCKIDQGVYRLQVCLVPIS